MSYTARDFIKLLSSNPDLRLIEATATADLVYNGVPHMSPSKKVVAPKLSEFDMQTLVFDEVRRREKTNREWEMVTAIPNGQFRPGQRMEPGIRSGFPDIIVPVARHSRTGLALELKVTPHKPTADQLEWHRKLLLRNWAVDVIWDDPQKVIEKIQWFLEG